MSSQSEKEFLSAVVLEKSPPFKDGKIEMGGKNEIQLLIKFYLENKKIVDSKENGIDPVINAGRFKINCIVGENGTGKSRLLKKIIQQTTKSEVLWDEFFLLEENLHLEKDEKKEVNKLNTVSVNKLIFENFKNLSKEWLGFNSLMNGIIFFNLLFNNLVLKAFLGQEIQGKNIWFANTSKPWFLPFNSDGYYRVKNIADKASQNEKEKELKESWNNKWKEVKAEYDKKDDYILAYIAKNNQFLQKVLDDKSDKSGKYILAYIAENNQLLQKELDDKSDIFENMWKLCIDECIKYTTSWNKNKLELIKSFFTETLYACDVKFEDWTTLSSLSAGEKVTLLRFTNIYMNILEKYNNWKNDFLILIDEPDLHLHLDWQRQYIQKLIDVFSTLPSDIKLHFIIATHSPFLISDLPTESIIALKKDDKWSTEVLELKRNSTFWANFVDLIRSGFFFKDQMLMWSFAEEIIKQIAEDDRKEILDHKLQKTDKEQKSESLENIKKMIWDDFLRDNLLYFKPY